MLNDMNKVELSIKIYGVMVLSMLENPKKWKMEVTCDPSLETNQVAVWFLVVASTKTQNNWREITRFSKQLGSLLSLETDVFVGLRSPG